MNRALKVLLLILVLTLITKSQAQAGEKIIVRVDGLSCAFCAYGLEKKLKELKGVEKVEINLKEGKVSLTLKEGETLKDETVKKAVKDSGFTPRDINRGESTPILH